MKKVVASQKVFHKIAYLSFEFSKLNCGGYLGHKRGGEWAVKRLTRLYVIIFIHITAANILATVEVLSYMIPKRHPLVENSRMPKGIYWFQLSKL